MTAHHWMHDAIRDIDKAFGDGFAAKNPALVGHYMATAAKDFTTAVLCVHIENATDTALRIAEAIEANDTTTGDLGKGVLQVAYAITANAAPGKDANGGYVSSLTEAVMGMTCGHNRIAEAIEILADAVREHCEEDSQ